MSSRTSVRTSYRASGLAAENAGLCAEQPPAADALQRPLLRRSRFRARLRRGVGRTRQHEQSRISRSGSQLHAVIERSRFCASQYSQDQATGLGCWRRHRQAWRLRKHLSGRGMRLWCWKQGNALAGASGPVLADRMHRSIWGRHGFTGQRVIRPRRLQPKSTPAWLRPAMTEPSSMARQASRSTMLRKKARSVT